MPRRKGLSPEEAELWARVAATASPLDARARGPLAKPAPPPAPPEPMQQTAAPRPQPGAVPAFRIGQSVQHPLRQTSTAPSPAASLSAQALRMDPKTHKRMTRGKLRPEARLDLHGLTLAEAHPRLIEFLISCHAAGLRLVLVITGKGRGDHGPLPTRPGALRHQVPFWLHSGPLSAVVQQATAAHHNHGGDGAYYVYLRRPRGAL